jgi:hypothetical protein
MDAPSTRITLATTSVKVIVRGTLHSRRRSAGAMPRRPARRAGRPGAAGGTREGPCRPRRPPRAAAAKAAARPSAKGRIERADPRLCASAGARRRRSGEPGLLRLGGRRAACAVARSLYASSRMTVQPWGPCRAGRQSWEPAGCRCGRPQSLQLRCLRAYVRPRNDRTSFQRRPKRMRARVSPLLIQSNRLALSPVLPLCNPCLTGSPPQRRSTHAGQPRPPHRAGPPRRAHPRSLVAAPAWRPAPPAPPPPR